MKTNSNPSYQA